LLVARLSKSTSGAGLDAACSMRYMKVFCLLLQSRRRRCCFSSENLSYSRVSQMIEAFAVARLRERALPMAISQQP
jgi:hypothetical protein